MSLAGHASAYPVLLRLGWRMGRRAHWSSRRSAGSFPPPGSGVAQLTDGKLRCAFLAEIGFRVSISQMIGDFTRLEQDIERHDHRSGFEDTIVRDHEGRHVLTTEGHLISL